MAFAATRLLRAACFTAGVVGCLALLWWCRPAAVGDLGSPDAATVRAAAWAGWLLGAWLAVSLAVTALAGAHRPAWSSQRRSMAALSPPLIRRIVRVALGASVTAAALGANPVGAFAADPHPRPHQAIAGRPTHVAGVPFSLDWPGLTGRPPGTQRRTRPPAVRRPVVAPAPHSVAPTTRTVEASVVVAAGDSLWSLAARALGPSATDAAVAAAWPCWWAANRTVVGGDPDLIHPGQRLVAPTAEKRSTP